MTVRRYKRDSLCDLEWQQWSKLVLLHRLLIPGKKTHPYDKSVHHDHQQLNFCFTDKRANRQEQVLITKKTRWKLASLLKLLLLPMNNKASTKYHRSWPKHSILLHNMYFVTSTWSNTNSPIDHHTLYLRYVDCPYPLILDPICGFRACRLH